WTRPFRFDGRAAVASLDDDPPGDLPRRGANTPGAPCCRSSRQSRANRSRRGDLSRSWTSLSRPRQTGLARAAPLRGEARGGSARPGPRLGSRRGGAPPPPPRGREGGFKKEHLEGETRLLGQPSSRPTSNADQ